MASRSLRRRNENHCFGRIVPYWTARARSTGVGKFREASRRYKSIWILLRKRPEAFRTNNMTIGSKLDRAGTLLTAEEVAALTDLSIDTLAQWRSQRRGIPYLKIGRSVRYALADVQAYLEGCRVSVSVPKERRQI